LKARASYLTGDQRALFGAVLELESAKPEKPGKKSEK
jgi:hypothetical protein